jgi:hypothetical protein
MTNDQTIVSIARVVEIVHDNLLYERDALHEAS